MDWDAAYQISDPVQKLPTDFLGTLCSNAFQQALIKLSVASWGNDANTNIIQEFQIYTSYKNQCFPCKTEDEKVRKVEETSLKCSHEEAHSWMLFHAKFINVPNKLAIRTVDPLIQIFLLLLFATWQNVCKG